MSDLIFRNAAIAAIEQARNAFELPDDVPGSRLVNAGFAAARGALEKVPSAAEWVSVKDRMPEKGSICLVCGKNGGMRVARASYYEPLDLWTVVGTGKPFHVTHWMELPAPPSD